MAALLKQPAEARMLALEVGECRERTELALALAARADAPDAGPDQGGGAVG